MRKTGVKSSTKNFTAVNSSSRAPNLLKGKQTSVLSDRMVQSRGQHQPLSASAIPHPTTDRQPELSDDLVIHFLYVFTRNSDTDESNMPSWEDPVSVFFSVTKPEIETSLYIKRLVRYAQCSRAAFIIGLIYLRRLEEYNSKLAISPYNMHRLLITSLMLAAKNLDDRCYSNAHYARVGGIASVKEVNRLELQMLALLRYDIFVSPEEYIYFVGNLKRENIPRSPTRISRIHRVFPAEARRSSQLSAPTLVAPRKKNKAGCAPTGSLRGHESDAMQVDSACQYHVDAPCDLFRVLPVGTGTSTTLIPVVNESA